MRNLSLNVISTMLNLQAKYGLYIKYVYWLMTSLGIESFTPFSFTALSLYLSHVSWEVARGVSAPKGFNAF